MFQKRIQPYLLTLILVAFAVSPSFALGDGNRNLLLIGVMGLSPLIILYFGRFDRINPLLIFFMLSIIIIPILHQPESMRWSTVLYSAMFCLTFITYNELLHQSYFRCNNYISIIKYLIYAYGIVLLIQQFCVLTGLPIFNASTYDPKEPWKLNSLAAEPSHSARIVALLMFCYISIKEIILQRSYDFKLDVKDDRWVWIAFAWTMITMGSATAVVFVLIVLLKFIRIQNMMPIFVLGVALIIAVNFLNIKSVDRTFKTLAATITFDEKKILEADHSAAMRIVPSIVVAKMTSLSSFDGWFGHGVDFTGDFLSSKIPGLPKGSSGGGMFQVWLEFGFISFALFVTFSLINTYRKGEYLNIVFWFILVFMYGINSQIVWLCIVLLFTNNHFFKIEKLKYDQD